MKQLYSSLALLLVVAAVGAWIYFQERGPIAQTGSTVLLRSDPQRVSNIVLHNTSGGRIALNRKSGDDWLVRRETAKAVAVPADEEAVQSLLEAVQLVQSGAVVEGASTEQIKEYGLEKPQGSLAVDGAKIEFGEKPSFDPSKVYARVTSGSTPQIALLPATLSDFTTKSFDEWRDKSALRVEADSVTKLAIKAPALQASFEREREGEAESESDDWKILTPVEVRADAGAVSSFLSQLPATKTERFLEDEPKNLAQWGLDKPFAQVDVTDAADRSTLRIGRVVEGGRAAQNSVSSVIFVVPDSLVGMISRPLREWRDKTVFQFTQGDVDSLKVAAREQQTTLTRRGLEWQREGDDRKSQPAAQQAATDILLSLQSLAAEEFIDKPQALSTYGLEKPALTVEVGSLEWDGTRAIQLGTRGGKVYARVQGEKQQSGDFAPTVYVVSPNTLESFKTALDVLFPSKKK